MLFRLAPLLSSLRRRNIVFLSLLHSFHSIHSSAFTVVGPYATTIVSPQPTAFFHTHTQTTTTTKMTASDAHAEEDPYLFLEEVESEESIAFAKSANEKCLAQLGDPSNTVTYRRVLEALESDDRIPHVVSLMPDIFDVLYQRCIAHFIITMFHTLLFPEVVGV